MAEPRFPWARPRHELLLLALVAVAALLPVYTVNAQDQARLCLTQAVLHGKLSNDECLSTSVDRASFGGHLYSDKAPGMSLIETPAAAALRLPPVQTLSGTTDRRAWAVRILAGGVAFLVAAFLVGRLGEGLAPGYGGGVLVAFALGTLVAPLAGSNFSHDTAAAAAFAAFLLAWRGRALEAGLVAGGALAVEYQTAAILIVLAAYVLFQGARALGRYAIGLVPGVVLLGAYDWAAFGSPLHTSYRYVSVKAQATGFFGIGIPHAHSTYEALVGNKGLLVAGPVLLAAAWGLVLLARRYPLEALLCGAVTVFYVLLDCGYFIPYGGVSPGPRFLVPALPFLAVGLGPAFAWRPRLVGVLTAISVVGETALTLVWSSNMALRHTIWGELGHVVVDGRSSRIARHLVDNAAGPHLGLALVVAAAGAAVVLALAARPLVVAIALAGVCAAGAAAALLPPTPPDLRTSISPSTTAAFPGDEVDYTMRVENASKSFEPHVKLTILLPPGVELLGRPTHELGSGCKGNMTIICDIGDFVAGMDGIVHIGLRIAPGAPAKLRVAAWAGVGDVRGKTASATVTTGAG